MQRCPACGATVRADAPWCSLCYAELTAPQHATAAAVTLPSVADEQAGADVNPARTWPCLLCGAHNDFERSACGGCGAAFLGGVDGNGAAEWPGGAALSRLSRGARLALAGLAALLLTALATGLFGVFALTGH